MSELPLNQILCGDCSKIMKTFPEDCIDLVVTSPPYWGLRDYGLGEDQLGLESHPQLFIDNITTVCGIIKRVLKNSGSFWLNFGDTYAANRGYQVKQTKDSKNGNIHGGMRLPKNDAWLQPKQLLGIPWRVAIKLQEQGWILRNSVIWYKPNHMPSSVKDRLTASYEFFFFFVKARKYFFDLDSIRQPVQKSDYKNYDGKLIIAERSKEIGFKDDYLGKPNHPLGKNPGDMWELDSPNTGARNKPPYKQNNPHLSRIIKGREAGHPLGKNPGDLWNIPTNPFPGAHFAVFPPKLIEPIIKAGCPPNGVVLDPFAGSGTALRSARKLGRKFIGIELNPVYAKMAEQRVRADKYKKPPEKVPKITDFRVNPNSGADFTNNEGSE